MPEPAPTRLRVGLDCPLPAAIAPGAPTTLLIAGWCHAPGSALTGLALEIDGVAAALTAWAMPRIGIVHDLHPGSDERALDDEALRAYRSGFWGLAPIPAGEAPCTIALLATLHHGERVRTEIATLPREPLPAPLPLPADSEAHADLVVVCMATFEPDETLLRRQIDSIRAQDHPHWLCVISDDASSPERWAAIERVCAGDTRFLLSRSPRRLGFYKNFERALALAPAEAAYLAPADQDDDWHPDKLSALLAAIGGAQLVYSDARIVSAAGALLAGSYWQTRANNHDDLLSLLVANAVTGAASLFPRRLLEDALPFPAGQFTQYHDHWLALVARSLGPITYVDRPLYDYVQHGSATLGHAAATRMPSLRSRLRRARSDPRRRVGNWRLHYFVDVMRLQVLASTLLARGGSRIAPPQRRALETILRADRSLPAQVRLAARGVREVVADRPETLGAEWMLSLALRWRRLIALAARDRRRRRLPLDALPPASFVQRPSAELPDDRETRDVAAKIDPILWRVDETAPQRINVLIPAIDLRHFFGGYIGKFNLAARLAERGLRVRIVTVDHNGALPADWRRRIESFSGLAGATDRIEFAFAREDGAVTVGRADSVIASTWWTAHHARDLVQAIGAERFLYLIQEYEPFTFALGTWSALAAESYTFPHTALFSTELLRGYFRNHGIGVFAGPGGDERSAAFQNAITDVTPPARAELAARTTRRLLFYARPEPHAKRNLFELGLLALRRAHDAGALAGWELRGIGTVALGSRLELGAGAELELLPRTSQADYGALLRAHDLGIALMLTPHPSLVPLEMAAAGLPTVTTTFENKTAAELTALSANLLPAPPTIAGVAAAIAAAAARAGDPDGRIAGATVAWSRDWRSALGDELIDRVLVLIGRR